MRDLAGQAEVGERVNERRPLPHDEDAEPAAGEPAGQPADRQHAQQGAHGAADAAVPAAAGERPPVGEHRAVGDQVEDEVVRLRCG